MTDKQVKKYCKGLCTICDEFGIYNEEPCIYKIANELEEKLSRKEQECEELKQWKKGAENLFKAQIDNPDKIINQYKQTLVEIKEIAENMNNECFYSDFDCEDCDMKNGCTYFNKKQILQKIKEVE